MDAQFRQAVEAFQRGDLDRARMLAEAEVTDAPSPQAYHLLGLVHCRLGDPASGVEHLRLAAEAEPENAGFQIMLMRAMVDAGRAAEVLDMPEPPAIRSAAALELWRTRGEAALAAEDNERSADAWRKIALAAPGDWRAWANLGNALASEEQWSEAAEALTKAAELNPSDMGLRRNAGAALIASDRGAEAIPHLQAVVAAGPGDAETRLLLAQALAGQHRHTEAETEIEAAKALAGGSYATELGLARSLLAQKRFAEAEEAYRRAAQFDPADRTVTHELGLLLERTNQLDALALLLDEALSRGLEREEFSHLWAARFRREGKLEEARTMLLKADPGPDPVRWNRLRAKIADAAGDSEEAFEATMAMNRATKDYSGNFVDFDEWRRRAAEYRDRLRGLANLITPSWGARVPRLSEPSPRQVAFLVGLPRSGTTLLDTFLMGHPGTAVLEEQELVGAAARVAGPIEELPRIGKDRLEKAKATYFDALHKHVSGKFEGIVVDKFPLNMLAGPFIEAMFPRAPIIFAQRHPCDVVLSGFMQSFVPNLGMASFLDIRDAADFYDAVMRVWTSSREAMALQVHTVVYEDLVRDPESSLRPALDFLGLDWDERVLDHRRTARERGAITTPSYDQVTEPLTSRPVGRWKQYRKQLEPVLPVLLPWAERLGYSD